MREKPLVVALVSVLIIGALYASTVGQKGQPAENSYILAESKMYIKYSITAFCPK